MAQRPCLDCGVLTPTGSRCPTHTQARNQIRYRNETPARKEKKALLYNKEYQKEAKRVREGAYQCHLCGGGVRVGDPFEADHVEPGNIYSQLLPAHRTCNRRKGNKPPQPR